MKASRHSTQSALTPAIQSAAARLISTSASVFGSGLQNSMYQELRCGSSPCVVCTMKRTLEYSKHVHRL